MSDNEQSVQSLGFTDMQELISMVGDVDLVHHLAAFRKWQDEDGTKTGLKAVLALSNESSPNAE